MLFTRLRWRLRLLGLLRFLLGKGFGRCGGGWFPPLPGACSTPAPICPLFLGGRLPRLFGSLTRFGLPLTGPISLLRLGLGGFCLGLCGRVSIHLWWPLTVMGRRWLGYF